MSPLALVAPTPPSLMPGVACSAHTGACTATETELCTLWGVQAVLSGLLLAWLSLLRVAGAGPLRADIFLYPWVTGAAQVRAAARGGGGGREGGGAGGQCSAPCWPLASTL